MVIATAREIYNPVQRDRVTFLKTADETGGELSLFEMEVALLAQMSDIKVVGPLALLEPLFGLLARIARRRGVEADLIARYGA